MLLLLFVPIPPIAAPTAAAAVATLESIVFIFDQTLLQRISAILD